MDLLIDIGNTRIKWAWLDGPHLQAMHAAEYAYWQLEDLRNSLFAAKSKPKRVLVSNVAGPKIANLLSEATHQTCSMQPEFAVSTPKANGVTNGYTHPAQLGVDRWLAMQAAWQITASTTLVVAIGTAMTIDTIDATGKHLGGQIMPGPSTMLDALHKTTSDIADRSNDGQGTGALFATTTSMAVQKGIQNFVVSSAMESARQLGSLTGTSPELIITGGASSWLTSSLPIASRSIPDLVLRGLALMAKPESINQ